MTLSHACPDRIEHNEDTNISETKLMICMYI